MTGLCAAFYLSRQLPAGAVVLLEAADRVGGTARTDLAEGFSCEWGPNGFLDKEPLTLGWAEDLGISGELVRADEAAARRFIYRKGELHEIKPPPKFLVSPLLSVLGRGRLLCEPLIKGKRDDTPETIWDFAARRIGREAADVLVSSMVSGVYGGDAKKLSLAHCFPRMAEMEREYGGLFKALLAKRKEDPNASPMGPKGVLTSFRKGIGSLPEEAAKQLNSVVRINAAAVNIERRGAEFAVSTASGETYHARAVVVASPAFAAAEMTDGLDKEVGGALRGIPYAGLSVVCAGFRREDVDHDLNGFGFLAPRIDKLRALGCLWTSSIFPGRAPEGWVMLRVMYGGSTDPEAVALPDAELVNWLAKDINPLLGIDRAPEFLRIYRHERGIPQYHMGHGHRLKTIAAAEEHNPGLYFAGNAYGGISLNDCVVSARKAVEKVMEGLKTS